MRNIAIFGSHVELLCETWVNVDTPVIESSIYIVFFQQPSATLWANEGGKRVNMPNLSSHLTYQQTLVCNLHELPRVLTY